MSSFSLKSYEKQLPGVRYRDGVLRLRPTWFATTAGIFFLVWGILSTAVGIAVRHLLPVIFILPVIAGPVVFVIGWRILRCRVVCENDGILVVNKWHSYTLGVEEITAAWVGHFEPSWFLPYRAPGTRWPDILAGCWLIKRDDCRVLCDALVASARDPLAGLPGDMKSEYHNPTDAKALILQRWIDNSTPSAKA